MSFLSNLFKKIFKFFRPGIEEFLKKNKEVAKQELIKVIDSNSGKEFHELKDQAWENIKKSVEKSGKEVAGNWISILLHLVFEEIKGELGQQ